MLVRGAVAAAVSLAATVASADGVLEYVKGDGTCHVDTDYVLDGTNRVEATVMVTATDNALIFGSRTSDKAADGFLAGIVSQKCQVDFANSTAARCTSSDLSKLTAAKLFIYDDSVSRGISNLTAGTSLNANVTAGSQAFTCPTNAWLFGASGNVWSNAKFKGRVYSFKVFREGAREVYMVPYEQGGVIGMYDLVRNRFFPNAAASGTFTAGPVRDDVRPGSGCLEYRLRVISNCEVSVGDDERVAGTNEFWIAENSPYALKAAAVGTGERTAWSGVPAGAVFTADGASYGATMTAPVTVRVCRFTPTHVWTGASGTDFATDGNWVDGSGTATTAPCGSSSVVFVPVGPANQPVASVAISIGDFYIGALTNEPGTAVFTAKANLENTADGVVHVLPGGKLTHAALPSSANTAADECYKLVLSCGSFALEAGGAVDVDGKGYASGKGPGYGGRVAHGGTGIGNLGKSYGSALCPTNCGTGNYTCGGGAVKITATGTARVDGSIHADGPDHMDSYDSGAGGSVWLTCAQLTGTGSIRANGGNTKYGSRTGSGGRVALHQTAATDFSAWQGTVKARGGDDDYNSREQGPPGTIYLQSKGQTRTNATLIVSMAENGDAHAIDKFGYVELDARSGLDVVGTLIVTNKGKVYVAPGETLKVYGDLLLNGGYASLTGVTVELAGTNDHRVSGSYAYGDFRCTEPGVAVTFGTGADDTFTTETAGKVTFRGSAEKPIALQGEGGSRWKACFGAVTMQDISHVTVSGSDASAGIMALAYDSTAGTGPANVNWSLMATPAAGATVTWTGSGKSSDWRDPANWSPNRVPLATDAVVLPAGATALLQTYSVSVGALSVAAGATLTLNGADLSVGGDVAVAGSLVFTAAETLSFGGDGTFANGSVTPASGALVMTGGGNQSAEFDGGTLYRVAARKSGGTVGFASGFKASDLDLRESPGTTFEFAAGEEVEVADLHLAGVTLVSSDPGTKWKLKVTSSQSVIGVTVSDSQATGVSIYADLTSSEGTPGSNVGWSFNSTAKRWIGTAGDGKWETAANWDPSGAPESSARVTVDMAVTVTATDKVTIQNLSLGNGSAAANVIFRGGADVSDGIDVLGGATLTMDKPSTVTGTVTIRDGGKLTHTVLPDKANTQADECYKLDLACAALVVETGGAVDADGKGYASGKGPGYCAMGLNGTCVAHGGTSSFELGLGKSYGSASCPTNCGTGYATRGGGAVKISVTGTARVDGSIHADGPDHMTDYSSGAGGSVWLTCAQLTGTGSIRANGGNTKYGNSTGSGGRVALHLTEATDFSAWQGTVKARGGDDDYGSRIQGPPGTVYLQAAGQTRTNATVIVSMAENGDAHPVERFGYVELDARSGLDVVGTLIVTNKGKVYLAPGATLKAYGDIRGNTGYFVWTNTTVELAGDAGQLLTGDQPYHNLTCTVPGKSLRFGTGASDALDIVAGGKLTIVSEASAPISLLSADGTNPWALKLEQDALHEVKYAAVSNSNAGVAGGTPALAIDSTDLGGNSNWTFSSAIKPGAPIYWTGAGADALWTTTENWEDEDGAHRAPKDSDRVIIPKPELATPPDKWPLMEGGSPTFNSITVAGGGALTLRGANVLVTNVFTVAGTLTAEGGTRITCSNTVNMAGGTFVPGQSVFRLVGPEDQSVNPGNCTFDRFEIEKEGGVVTFGDGLKADVLDVQTTGPATLAFAPGRTVEAQLVFVRGLTNGTEGTTYPLDLASSAAGQRWQVRIAGAQFFSGVDVSDSEALGAAACADTTSHDGGNNVNWSFGTDRVTWTGAKSTSFGDAENWFPQRVPGAGSSVVLSARLGETKTIAATSATVLSNLCVGACMGTVSLSFAGPLTVCDSLGVYTNGTLSLSSKNEPNVVSNDVHVGSGGTLTHAAASAAANTVAEQDKRFYLVVLGNMTVEPCGVLTATCKGFAGGKGPGYYVDGRSYAQHAGCLYAGFAYGRALDPESYGSGGPSSRGGGEIRLSVGGTLRMDGMVASDGSTDNSSSAGGTVNVRCGTLSGGGTFTARGLDCEWYSAGGGGRLSVRANVSMEGFTGGFDAGGGQCWGHLTNHGGPGTVYVEGPGQSDGAGTLIVDNGRLRAKSGWAADQLCGFTELPLEESAGSRPYKRTALVLGDLAELRLTDDMTVGDLDIRHASARLKLQGHTLTVRSLSHKDGRGWADDLSKLVVPEGGEIIWRPNATILIVR